YPFLCGGWAPERCGSEPSENIGQLPPVLHLARVFGSALPGVFCGARPGVLPVQRGLDLQGPADSQIVQALVEFVAQSGKRAGDLHYRSTRIQLQSQYECLNPRVGVQAVVTVGRGDALSVVERGLCLLELPGFDQCRAQARVEPPEGRV